MKGEYILYACNLLHFDFPEVFESCNPNYVCKTFENNSEREHGQFQ